VHTKNGDRTPERSEIRRKTRRHCKIANEFLGEWQAEPYRLKNGRVRAYTKNGDKTPERSEMRRKTRRHSKIAGEFLGEWQGEPYGLKNGRVRAYQEWRQDTGEERDEMEDETAQ
jgi:hypothetical protein